MPLKVIQCNLARSWAALDLLRHHCRDNTVDLSLISEPVAAPALASWLGSLDGLAAITWNPERIGCSLIRRGERFVAVRSGDTVFVACYCSPNVSMACFLELLDDMEHLIGDLSTSLPPGSFPRVLLGGDFNAKSPFWGSATFDARGEALQNWAAQLDLCLLNTGDLPTCVRPQGVSHIDTMWATITVAGETRDWRVMEDTETLSDHPYITFDTGPRLPEERTGGGTPDGRCAPSIWKRFGRRLTDAAQCPPGRWGLRNLRPG